MTREQLLPLLNHSTIIQAMEDGTLDPLEIAAWAKGITQIAEWCENAAKEKIVSEMERNGLKEQTGYGFRFVLREYLGAKYDYSQTNHPAWIKLNELAKSVKADLDAVQKQLQATKKPFTIVDEDTGEVITVNPPSKSGKTGVVMERDVS
jgi:hypothetical protein